MRPIYLDHAAATPVPEEILQQLLPFFSRHYADPAGDHAWGRGVREAVELARSRVAALIGADEDEVVLTAGGTEANNLALLGTLLPGLVEQGAGRIHAVVSAVEHASVSRTADWLATLGCEVSVAPAEADGRVDAQRLVELVREDTRLVSLVHADPHRGVLQPVEQVAASLSDTPVLVHCDASQVAGKLPLDVGELGVDLLTISGHKLSAPKGCGALFVRRGAPLTPLRHGDEDPTGQRAGMPDIPALVGLGAAAVWARREQPRLAERLESLRDRLQAALLAEIPGLIVEGGGAARAPHLLCCRFPQVDGARLRAGAEDVCMSPGPSRDTVRLSVGPPTTEDEVDRAAAALIDTWERLVSE